MVYSGLRHVFGEHDILRFVEKREIPSKAEVEAFLKLFKSCWDGSLVPRKDPRNDDALTILGILPKHRAEEIRRLAVENYFRGPSPDHDGNPSKEWWEFGLYVKRHEIYIKIAVHKKRGRCMSFHIADWEITYPYKERG